MSSDHHSDLNGADTLATDVPQRAPLPVLGTAREILVTFFRLLRFWPPIAAIPLVGLFLAEFALLVLSGELRTETGTALVAPHVVDLVTLLTLLVSIVCLIVFLVAWFQLVLLGPESYSIGLGRRHARLLNRLVQLLLIGLVAAPAIMFPAFALDGMLEIAPTVTLLGLLIWYLVISILGLVLPAAALDRNYGFRNAWTDIRGVFVQALVLIALLLAPPDFFLLWLRLFLEDQIIKPDISQNNHIYIEGTVALLNSTTFLLQAALAATLLSVIFKRRAGIRTSA